jgi:hypothetical protein
MLSRAQEPIEDHKRTAGVPSDIWVCKDDRGDLRVYEWLGDIPTCYYKEIYCFRKNGLGKVTGHYDWDRTGD